jgi:hypothetical protein
MLGGPINPSERKALLIALIPCLLFIAFLTVLRGATGRNQRRIVVNTPPPSTAKPNRFYVEEPVVADLYGKPAVVPVAFSAINFKTRSYGPYKQADGKSIDLHLEDGEYRMVEKDHSTWFSLKELYYADVTGDGREEAITMLSHVSCDAVGSCDGGTYLFYIYTVRNGKLRTLWQYETGANAYGCGLKSLTVDGKQFVLELFGRCPKEGTNRSTEEKFIVQDLTLLLFEFDGRRFVRQSIEFVPTAARSVRNYTPNVQIYPSPSQPEYKIKKVPTTVAF